MDFEIGQMVNNEHIILFDGVCNLCNTMVQFVIKRDPKAKFKFASLQSESGQAILKKFNLPVNDFNSFVYIQGEQCYLRSSAALRVAKELGGAWKLFYAFIIIPKFIRDFFYNMIAKRRYSMFGKQDSCMIPTSELKSRFLE
ncbi:MAG: thiol-disulfide oxidoreductase DCC family protein [Bacteroidota bacterium]|nr:thiol-disulfide oxidoreductase DCC family protein [Bacteroidota bacterium]